MNAFNYDAIIRDMAVELGRRVNRGEDLQDAAFSIAVNSKWFAYTTFHFQILDACKANTREIAEEHEIGFNESFSASVSRMVYLCLSRDTIDAYMERGPKSA